MVSEPRAFHGWWSMAAGVLASVSLWILFPLHVFHSSASSNSFASAMPADRLAIFTCIAFDSCVLTRLTHACFSWSYSSFSSRHLKLWFSFCLWSWKYASILARKYCNWMPWHCQGSARQKAGRYACSFIFRIISYRDNLQKKFVFSQHIFLVWSSIDQSNCSILFLDQSDCRILITKYTVCNRLTG